MKKIAYLLFLICCGAMSQQLTVSSSASIAIDNTASVNTFGLEILPNSNYSISDNTITLSDIQVEVSGAKQSILRVYEFLNPITNYSGSLVLNYEDAEVLGGTESDLDIELETSPLNWLELASTVNDNLNTITLDALLNNATFERVTAAADDIPLTINQFEFDALNLYPNPTRNKIHIQSELNIKAQLFNSLGQELKVTVSKLLDMGDLRQGVYFLKLTDIESNKSNTYQIIKK